jgi:hypothetical protein
MHVTAARWALLSKRQDVVGLTCTFCLTRGRAQNIAARSRCGCNGLVDAQQAGRKPLLQEAAAGVSQVYFAPV